MDIDGVEVGVTDATDAAAAYARLLGTPGAPTSGRGRRFVLARGAVELAAGGPAGLRAIAFRSGTVPAGADFHGLDVRLVDATARAGTPAPGGPVIGIDHVVVHSTAPDRAIALWRDRLGLRLALDRVFPERGLRLVFFRSGGITLEFASPWPPGSDTTAPDRFYGLSYRVADLETHRARLLEGGVDVSPMRPGMRPGTRVATVRSGTAGVPTLLLEVLAAPSGT
jgi:catechol 2,3-dioxygenase-like lactoylglutathione lyase family enzyme